MYAGLSAAVVLIAALGGTAYASENALPGDALYPVKVGFAEPLQTALVPSDRGKAAWHAILAERRLEETAQLAAAGRLSTSRQDELAESFTAQVTASENSADHLQQNGDTNASLSVRSDLEARLSAHEQILAVIDQHFALASSTGEQGTHQALSRMLALVDTHVHAVAATRLALEDAISPGSAEGKNADVASTTSLAFAADIVTHAPARPAKLHALMPSAGATPAAQIQANAAARTTEVQDIIERNAVFLKAFLPAASTTATSTATSTVSVTATTTASTTEDANEDANESEVQGSGGASVSSFIHLDLFKK